MEVSLRVPWPVFLLRSACLAALAASAALTSDALHPDRAFCPLEAACALARGSALGTMFGLPTSVFGILAFLGLFLMTLLPPRLARFLARPAAWGAALMGLGFVAYQAFELGSFCPLCLVADVSALVAGAAAFLWQPMKVQRSRRKGRPPGESGLARLRWATVAGLAVLVPLLWPKPEAPSWVPVPEGVASVDDEEYFTNSEPTGSSPPDSEPLRSGPVDFGPADTSPAGTEGGPPPPTPAPDDPYPQGRFPVPPPFAPLPEPPPAPTPAPATPPPLPHAPPVPPEWYRTSHEPEDPSARTPEPTPAPPTPTPAPRVSQPAPRPAPKPPKPVRPRTPAPPAPRVPEPAPEPEPAAAPAPEPPAPRREVAMVEYLNPFCAHCRATHTRLDRVIASFESPVKRRRVYVWPGRRAPYWAYACACAGAQGLEDALFAELLQTSRDDQRSVRAAAQRVGLDLEAFDACLASGEMQERLDRNYRAMDNARIKGLPTLDIGRRRLMGEQSEAEILDALRAAARELE